MHKSSHLLVVGLIAVLLLAGRSGARLGTENDPTETGVLTPKIFWRILQENLLSVSSDTRPSLWSQ